MIQCDWISAKIVSALPHVYESGRLITLGPHGELLGERFAPAFVEDRASSSDRLRVFTPDDRTLWLSGNPCKVFQRHNLWGSPDHLGLFLEAGLWVREKAGLFPSRSTFEACRFDLPRFTRIDLTRSYRFPTHQEAQEFIRWSVGSARSRHGAAKLYGSETGYFGQNSTRWSLKVYDKHAEFQRSLVKSLGRRLLSIVGDGSLRDPLLDWSRGVVRFELTLRAPELDKIGPARLALFLPDDFQTLWQSYFDRIQWTENAAMSRNLPLDRVPPKMQAVLLAWSTGADLRKLYPRPSFYRYRRIILDACGIDIALPPPEASDAPSVPSGASLDPKGWDPEPLDVGFVPRDEVKRDYLPSLFH